MRSFAVTAANDLAISGRSMDFVTDIDAVLAVCAHCARALLGEMVFAQQDGMPYAETVWVGGSSAAPFEAAFRRRILRVEGVVRIDYLETEISGGVMTYRATIVTEYGSAVLNG